MNAGPPRVLQGMVRCLLPPASREHVLGDLEERFQQSGSAVQYLSDAIGAMPYVIWGQAQRNVDARLLAVEVLALTASFVAAAYRLWSVDTLRVLFEQNGIARVFTGVAVALAALALGDAYVEPSRRFRFHLLRQYCLAYGSAFLAAIAFRESPSMVVEAAKSGFILLVLTRIIFTAVFQREPAVPCGPATLSEVRHEAERFQRAIWQRNITEYGAVVFIVLGSLVGMTKTRAPLLRVGLGLAIAGSLDVAYQLRRRAASRKAPPDLSPEACLEFYRVELTRQRDALRTVSRWYIAPLLPSMAVMVAERIATEANPWKPLATALGLIPFCAVIILLNRKGAVALQRKIEALDALEKQS